MASIIQYLYQLEYVLEIFYHSSVIAIFIPTFFSSFSFPTTVLIMTQVEKIFNFEGNTQALLSS